MTTFRRVVRIHHEPDNLFQLVSDIGAYPDFIKWVQSMRVEDVRKPDDNKAEMLGHARVGFKGFSEKFSTRVATDAEKRTIFVDLVQGPLKHLKNSWEFKDAENGTDINFYVDFEFKNLLLRALAAANFELAVNRIMAAFIAEADKRFTRTDA